MLLKLESLIISTVVIFIISYEFQESLKYHKFNVNRSFTQAMFSTISFCLPFSIIYYPIKDIIPKINRFISYHPHKFLIILIIILCIIFYLSYLPYKKYNNDKNKSAKIYKEKMKKYHNSKKKKIDKYMKYKNERAEHPSFSFKTFAQAMGTRPPSQKDIDSSFKELNLRNSAILSDPPKKHPIHIRFHICVKFWMKLNKYLRKAR